MWSSVPDGYIGIIGKHEMSILSREILIIISNTIQQYCDYPIKHRILISSSQYYVGKRGITSGLFWGRLSVKPLLVFILNHQHLNAYLLLKYIYKWG